MLLPERGRPGCSMIYTQLFPDGLSIDMTPDEILEELMGAEEWEFEIIEDEEEEETAEE